MGCNHRKRVHAQMSARRRTRGRDLGLGCVDGAEYLAHAIEVEPDFTLGKVYERYQERFETLRNKRPSILFCEEWGVHEAGYGVSR